MQIGSKKAIDVIKLEGEQSTQEQWRNSWRSLTMNDSINEKKKEKQLIQKFFSDEFDSVY